MIRFRFIALSVVLLALMLPACADGMPAPSPSPPPTETALPVTATLIPPETFTPVPPSETPTSSPTLTPTATFTYAPTQTNTPTPLPPSMTVNQNTVCRSGPGTNYAIIGYLAEGDQPPVSGVVEMEIPWWYVTLESGRQCFVPDTVVTMEGEVASVPALTPPPTPTSVYIAAAPGNDIYYFVASVGTGGPFGCGDNLYYVFTGIQRTGDLETDIAHALNALFSNHQKYVNGYYNPMYASSLRVSDVDVLANGSVNIYLDGTLARPQTKCESALMYDQIWGTVETQFPQVGRVVIRLQGPLLADLLVVNK